MTDKTLISLPFPPLRPHPELGMNPELEGKKLLKKSKTKRRAPYRYHEGTTILTFSPRKLASQSEQALAAFLVQHVTQTEAARLMNVSVPAVRNAVRAWHYQHAAD